MKTTTKTPRVILEVDRESRQITVKFENWHSMPVTVLDRVDILIEKALYQQQLKQRQDAARDARTAIGEDHVA